MKYDKYKLEDGSYRKYYFKKNIIILNAFTTTCNVVVVLLVAIVLVQSTVTSALHVDTNKNNRGNIMFVLGVNRKVFENI